MKRDATALLLRMTAAERSMVEEKAAAEGVNMTELVIRAVHAYNAMPVADRVASLELRVAALERSGK